MYHFSRSIYRELAPDIIEDRSEREGPTNHERVLRSCETCVERLATDWHYFAKPTKTLFNDIRVYFPMSSQLRVYKVVDRYMTFARDFATLPILNGIIGDPHFVTRDRMGRELAFMCRVATNNWSSTPRGIAVDEQTALLIDGGVVTVVGNSTAYFLRAPGPAQVCSANTPLTYLNVTVQRIAFGGTFNLSNWTATGATNYSVSANAGVLSSTQSGGSAY